MFRDPIGDFQDPEGLVTSTDKTSTKDKWQAYNKTGKINNLEQSEISSLEKDLKLRQQRLRLGFGGAYFVVKNYDPEVENKTKVKDIIGLPPQVHIDYGDDHAEKTTKHILSAYPMVTIIPAYPEFGGADDASSMFDLFEVSEDKGIKKYQEIKENLGLSSDPNSLKIAYQNNTVISESFNSEYGPSMFEEMANIGSTRMAEMRYVMGAETPYHMLSKIKGNISPNQLNALQDSISPFFNSATDYIFNIGNTKLPTGSNPRLEQLRNFYPSSQGSGMSGTMGGAMDYITGTAGKLIGKGVGQLLIGSRVDFPQIWKGSSYSPSYSITVKLYNPRPDLEESYIQHIVKPLARILALMTPIADSDTTFAFPLLCKVKAPGLFNIESGFISSVEVTKGGENNDITFAQRPNEIDVSITFGELHNVMVSESGDAEVHEDKPTLKSYINTLLGKTKHPKILDRHLDFRSPGDRSDEIDKMLQEQRKRNFLEGDNAVLVPTDGIPSVEEIGRKPFSVIDSVIDPALKPIANMNDFVIEELGQITNQLSGSVGEIFDSQLLQHVESEIGQLSDIIGQVAPGVAPELRHRLAVYQRHGLLAASDEAEQWFNESYDELNHDGTLDAILDASEGLEGIYPRSDEWNSQGIAY